MRSPSLLVRPGQGFPPRQAGPRGRQGRREGRREGRGRFWRGLQRDPMRRVHRSHPHRDRSRRGRVPVPVLLRRPLRRRVELDRGEDRDFRQMRQHRGKDIEQVIPRGWVAANARGRRAGSALVGFRGAGDSVLPKRRPRRGFPYSELWKKEAQTIWIATCELMR
ncbi:hypothetical protein DFJ74DRAFT_91568 [Hyaloraphidium curvatum]|nr:hypothetical protein DFJ74DRAFT_91568 [Hyaloraphidium curvatum]